MTYPDPGAPGSAGRREDEDAIALPDESENRKEEKKAPGGASTGPHSPSPEGAAGGGGNAGGGRFGETAGGASDSNEFLGVEKDFWMRLLYIMAAGFVAWVSFWFIIILAVAQIIYRLAAGHTNADLRGFTANMIQYVRDLLSFVTLVSDEKPFLFGGKFPDMRSGGDL